MATDPTQFSSSHSAAIQFPNTNQESVCVTTPTTPSASALEQKARSILYAYPVGVAVAEQDFISRLLAQHPDATAKIGSGISHFTVDVDRARRTRHFRVHRTDGSSTDFSFKSCLAGSKARANRERSRIKKAARGTVDDQIAAFRRRQFSAGPVVCPLTGEYLQLNKHTHVYHHPVGFDELLNHWLAQEGLDLLEIRVSPRTDNSTEVVMVDPRQRESWATFHQFRAGLRVVSGSEHLRQKRKIDIRRCEK